MYLMGDFGSFYGNEVDTIVVALALGNTENRIVWGVVLNGIPPVENNIEFVYCPPFDTIYYEIFY